MQLEEFSLANHSEEHSKDLTTGVLLTGLFVINDTVGGGKDNITELPGWEELGLPVFEILELDIEPWADGNTLVEPAKEVDDDLAAPVVIDDLEFADITSVHHNLEELDDNLASWADEDLALAPALSVSDCLKSVCQHGSADHSWKGRPSWHFSL